MASLKCDRNTNNKHLPSAAPTYPPWENSRGCGYTSIMCIRVGCVRLGGRHWKGFFPFSTFEQEWEVGMTKLYTHTTHTHTIYSTSITSRWSSRSVNKYRVNNSCPVWLCVGDKLAEKHTRRKESVFFLFSLPRVCTLNMLRRCDAVDNFSIQHWIGIVGWTHAVMLNRLSRNFVKNFKTNKKKSWVESVEKKNKTRDRKNTHTAPIWWREERVAFFPPPSPFSTPTNSAPTTTTLPFLFYFFETPETPNG